MLVALLAQSAPVASPPAVTPQHAEWVVLALALITTLGNIVLAIVRRTSGAKLAAVEKTAVTAKSKSAENAEKLLKVEGTLTEHTHRIDDLDERLCAPAPMHPEVQRVADRLTVIEGDMRAEKTAREARREDQHRQELSLTREFSSLTTTVNSLSKQVEKLHDR